MGLVCLRPDAPELDEDAADRLKDAHMAHLADLHEAGHLIAAGPLSDEKLRGLNIMNLEPEAARVLTEQDPAVLAGRSSVQVIRGWFLAELCGLADPVSKRSEPALRS